eukprot:scaffold26582_cov155-Skeletonema_menzelii.AAC.4
MSKEVKSIELDVKGIPLKSPYPEGVSVVVLYSAMTTIITAIGIFIAYFASYYTDAKVAAANSKIAIISEYDLGWLYLGLFLIRILTLPININLGKARKASKAALPDQHVYKACLKFAHHVFEYNATIQLHLIVMGAEGSKLGYVLMENEGVHGTFNRAQRALQNYHENFPGVVVQYVAASFVFPFEAFVLGYTDNVDGRMKGRLPGYFAMSTIGGMIVIIAFKALSP